MATHHIAAGKQMLVVGPARVDIKGATYEQHFKEKDFSLPKQPVLNSISPNNAVIGGEDLTMEVIGSGFLEESVIVFNGGEEPTTFVSATRLTTIVKPSTATTPGTYPVGVVGADGEASFTFTEAPLRSRRAP